MVRTANSLEASDPATQIEKRKLLAIGISGAIVAAIIILECATVHRYLAGGHSPGKAEAQKALAAEEHVEMHDVDLGKFSLITSDPDSSGSLLVEFHLVGSVVAGYVGKTVKSASENAAERDGVSGQAGKSSDAGDGDNAAFEELFRHERSRFRDQVIGIIGNAQISALSDPGFEVIKKQILARTNLLLAKPLLKAVRFSDFAVVQQ